jgi:hypothetical protein
MTAEMSMPTNQVRRSYQIETTIPRYFFPGKRSNNALEDIEDEIYSHSGIRDNTKRDELVKAITGSFQFFPIIQYTRLQKRRKRFLLLLYL